MSQPLRKVRRPDPKKGLAGFEVAGMPHTYSEEDAKRFQYMDEDGEFHLPTDGVLAEVDEKKKGKSDEAKSDEAKSDEPEPEPEPETE